MTQAPLVVVATVQGWFTLASDTRCQNGSLEPTFSSSSNPNRVFKVRPEGAPTKLAPYVVPAAGAFSEPSRNDTPVDALEGLGTLLST